MDRLRRGLIDEHRNAPGVFASHLVDKHLVSVFANEVRQHATWEPVLFDIDARQLNRFTVFAPDKF